MAQLKGELKGLLKGQQKGRLKGQLKGQQEGQLMVHQNQLDVLINGLVTAFVMITTTILNVILMEVIVVQRNLQMDGITTAKFVNVLKCQKQLKYLLNQLRLHLIVLINGLVTTSVMIKTTILNVKWMEVIVVKKNLLLDGITTAKFVNVLKFQKQLKLLL